MKRKKKLLLISILFALAVLFTSPVYAATYKTISSTKTKYGSYYVWRPYNTQIYFQKVGSSTAWRISGDVYTLAGATNGSILYYTSLQSKFAGQVTLYKVNLKTRSQKKIGVIKNALHIVTYRSGYVYGNAASYGKSNNKVYRFNVSSKKRSIFLSNFWAERASGQYLFGTRNGVKYHYDIANKRLTRYNWKYIY